MLSNDREERIRLLKRKNRRSNLIKELVPYIKIDENSFLEPNDNDEYCKIIFKKIGEISNKEKVEGLNFTENVQISLDYLNNLKEKNKNLSKWKKGFLLFYTEYEIEVVEIDVKDVFDNLELLFGKIGFSSGYGDFILVDNVLNYGVCIERTEYFYELSIWGL